MYWGSHRAPKYEWNEDGLKLYQEKVTKISTDHDLIQLIETQTKASKHNIDAVALLFPHIITQGLKESTAPAPPQKSMKLEPNT